jgi:hypothetical protein
VHAFPVQFLSLDPGLFRVGFVFVADDFVADDLFVNLVCHDYVS